MEHTSYYNLIETQIRDGKNDTEVIKAVLEHYGIRSYSENKGRFENIDKCIMKHLRQDIKEIRGNFRWMQSLGLR
jgi:hypothetical protein